MATRRQNAYFASRPRHVLCAAGIALDQPEAVHRLFLVERFAAGEADRLVATLQAWEASPFGSIVRLPNATRYTHRGSWPLGVWRGLVRFLMPYANRRRIRREFAARPPDTVYACVDHLVEVQYAMHLAKRLRHGTRCVHVEDGSAAYVDSLPEKAQAFPLMRRLIKTIIRRLHHGSWWQKVEVLGTSRWIDGGVFSFPDLVRPELRRYPGGHLSPTIFHGSGIEALATEYAARFGLQRETIERVEVLVALAASTSAKRIPGYETTMAELCNALSGAGVRVCVKHHPREQDPGFFGIGPGDNLQVLPKEIPFEILLLLIRKPDITVVGDISTAMMSTRWLLPESRILAIRHQGHGEIYMNVFSQLGIVVVSDPAEVALRMVPPITATGN
jgi:hypothetical protein